MIIKINTIQTMRKTTPSLASAIMNVMLLPILLLGAQDGSVLVVDKSPFTINKTYYYNIWNYTIIT